MSSTSNKDKHSVKEENSLEQTSKDKIVRRIFNKIRNLQKLDDDEFEIIYGMRKEELLELIVLYDKMIQSIVSQIDGL